MDATLPSSSPPQPHLPLVLHRGHQPPRVHPSVPGRLARQVDVHQVEGHLLLQQGYEDALRVLRPGYRRWGPAATQQGALSCVGAALQLTAAKHRFWAALRALVSGAMNGGTGLREYAVRAACKRISYRAEGVGIKHGLLQRTK